MSALPQPYSCSVIAGLNSAILAATAHLLPESIFSVPHAMLMKKVVDSPRGRFVRAHIRRNPADPADYFNVSDYQEKMDRLRRKQMRLAVLQLKFSFMVRGETKVLQQVNEPIPMKISVEIDHTQVDGDHGAVEGLCLVCTKCGHQVEVFGTSGESARYGATKLRDECPMNEDNFYDVDHWE